MDAGDPVFAISDLLPPSGAETGRARRSPKRFEAEKMNIILAHRPVENAADSKDADTQQPPKEKIKARILEILHAKYGIVEEDLYSAELQAVPAGPARYVGLDSALIGGYGQDDRICVFAALEALLQDGTPGIHPLCAVLGQRGDRFRRLHRRQVAIFLNTA